MLKGSKTLFKTNLDLMVYQWTDEGSQIIVIHFMLFIFMIIIGVLYHC